MVGKLFKLRLQRDREFFPYYLYVIIDPDDTHGHRVILIDEKVESEFKDSVISKVHLNKYYGEVDERLRFR